MVLDKLTKAMSVLRRRYTGAFHLLDGSQEMTCFSRGAEFGKNINNAEKVDL